MIIEQIETGRDKVFCYLVGCESEKKALMIDPGGDEEKLLDRLRQLGLELVYVVNTHAHADHTCGNAKIKKATGAAIVMHRDDHAFLRERGLHLSPPADRLVAGGEVLHFGTCALQVIHTPGHTPGSICLYGHGNLFTGDSLFVGAAGRVDLPGGDFNTLISSLEKNIATLPDDTVVWPGHDYGDTLTTTIGREKKENPFLGGEW